MLRHLLTVCFCTIPTLSFVIPSEAEVLPEVSLRSPQVATLNKQYPIPSDSSSSDDDDGDTPLPVVIWHGLGDSADAEGLNDLADLVGEVNPGTYVHLVSLADGSADRSQSWFGDVNDQIDLVCHQLATDPILSTAPAIDAIGFSQGGQFMRGYIQRCGHLGPKVRSFITFGSQHLGIGAFQECSGWTDLLCNAAKALLTTGLIWSDYIQTKVVPAQYYRPVNDYDNYLEHSNLLADLNNERSEKNKTYADNLSQLEKFVMIIFQNDTVVIPKETGWFAEVDTEADKITYLNETKLYKEDWIGLKKLDERGALVFDTVPGGHMQLNDKDLRRLFKTYFGPAKSPKNEDTDWQSEL